MVKFGIISDVQYASQEGHDPEKRPAPLGIQKLTEAIAELNKHDDLDFVVNLGDLIDRDPANFPAILEVFAKCKFPVWHALGNHDFSGPKNDKGYKAEALAAFGMSDSTRYYYKDVDNWRFIVLDTNEVGTIEHKKNTPEWTFGKNYRLKLEKAGKINAQGWNGAISDKQMEWLNNSIDSANDTDMNCIIFAHHPIYPEHRENALNNIEILNLVSSKTNVKAYINGHNHDGNYGVYKGLHCWTIEGMMDYKNKTAYAIATIQDNKLYINGYGRVSDRVMKLR